MTDHSRELGELLKDRDQLLMAAWTLPNEGTLTDLQRKQAMDNFIAYRKRVALANIQVARQVGTPKTTTINDLCKGVFRENADDHIRKLNAWVEQHARQQAVKLPGKHITTLRVARLIEDTCRLVRENETMGIVVGPTGIGKTWCAQALHAKYTGAVMVTAQEGTTTRRGMTRALAAQLSVLDPAFAGKQFRWLTMYERVIKTLTKSSRLLIIDEGQKLSEETLELLREIHDATGCPIFMLANKDLQDVIERRRDPDRGQLYSRFDIIKPLTEGFDVNEDGGKPLHTLDDIRKLYAQAPIRLSPDAERYLQGIANDLGSGSLRRCGQLVKNAARRARTRQNLEDEDSVMITADDLSWAEERLKPSKLALEEVRGRRDAAVNPIAATG